MLPEVAAVPWFLTRTLMRTVPWLTRTTAGVASMLYTTRSGLGMAVAVGVAVGVLVTVGVGVTVGVLVGVGVLVTVGVGVGVPVSVGVGVTVGVDEAVGVGVMVGVCVGVEVAPLTTTGMGPKSLLPSSDSEIQSRVSATAQKSYVPPPSPDWWNVSVVEAPASRDSMTCSSCDQPP